MIHNDALRSIRFMLKARETRIAEIIKLTGLTVPVTELEGYLKKEEEPGFVLCPDKVMAHFLNGLVIYKRGQDDARPPMPIEVPVSNNQILKKLQQFDTIT